MATLIIVTYAYYFVIKAINPKFWDKIIDKKANDEELK